ncbi:ABC transporter permease [Geoalkalibacter halelectricus]|uniref:ABC transporter permease n=1 Tax=Geoalkalibacter halelectricus TaxID=2847045 RepID=A0ABY5ZIM6_9BACT|nr:ABC transporter permease [Geoalkalibacter halelectricus]MDO3379618.1 ABC transporter permease [Geoalkalibacter halelectricus]UWZ78566.1 ABC transporter permease [Geoalkalibacter halelectricus]
MNILQMTVRNVTRRRGRFIFTLMGITVGIAALVTFLALGGGLKREIQREANALGAHLIVTPKGSCAYEQVSILAGEPLPINITEDEVARVAAIDGLEAVPLITVKTGVNNNPVPITGVPVDQMKAFKEWRIAEGRYFSSQQDEGILVGGRLAQDERLAIGDTLRVRGTEMPIVGIIERTGNRDDNALFIPLPVAQRLFEAGDMVSYVLIRVDDLSRVDQYILEIQETVNLGVVSDEQLLASVLAIVGTVGTTMQLVAVVAVLAAAFGIVNTMLTATYERRREIGILQAMGARRRVIFTLFMLESGFYGLLGGITGVIAGLIAARIASPLISSNAFTVFVQNGDAAMLDFSLLVTAIGFSMIAAIVAGVYPAWRASQLSPVEAISYE